MNHASGGDGFWHRARFARLENAVGARSWRARRTWPAAAVSSARMRAPTAFSATQSGRGGGTYALLCLPRCPHQGSLRR